MIPLTKKEKSVIEYIREKRVVTKVNIIERYNISPKTIIRALSKYGYYSSCNCNAMFYTLCDIPTFDNYNLWWYNKICFSKYKNINETIIKIIDQSKCGFTKSEMNSLLETETKNLLSRLCVQKCISKFYIGHQAIYLSADKNKQMLQKKNRNNQKLLELKNKQLDRVNEGVLPKHIDAKVIILVLIHMIKKPDVTIASLSMTLQAQGIKVFAEDVRTIINFYGLEKKTAQ